jgi:superfamily II DNA or RNA helicase
MMLEMALQGLIREQRPYYQLQGNQIRGVDNQYWLVFKHRDADNVFKNVVSFLGMGTKVTTNRLLRVDPCSAKVFVYSPRKEGDIPSTTLLRTANLATIEKFLTLETSTQEDSLLKGSFLELKLRRRRFNLPEELSLYNHFISEVLERTAIYRRSTAYFDSGVLKLYEEPLQQIVKTEGQIRLLMDWQGFTKRADIQELEQLQDPEYRSQFVQRSLNELLQGLDEGAFNSTEILAELVRLGFLTIKLIKMQQGKAIYHKKTGIFSDSLGNHVLHEGSDNFTRAAHSRNAESVTFLYSSESIDEEAIQESIAQFDQEWQTDGLAFDLSQEFLQQVLVERDRRAQLQPTIETITPDTLTPGEITATQITGKNLDKVRDIEAPYDSLVDIKITEQTPTLINAQIDVASDHPPQALGKLKVKTDEGGYDVNPASPPQVSQTLEIPDFPEIEGFKEAVEILLNGRYGKPTDFLYWMAQQRPRQFRIEHSDLLEELVNQNILFEHQKSGAQHCLRVMQDFGVAVCADAVGLGKTRLAAAVARLYRQQNGQAKIAVIAAKKLLPNWEREMAELGFQTKDYELYNKNLMSRKGNNFQTDFSRYGGPDLVIIDEAHEGIRNYNNRIHRTCLEMREQDSKNGRQRHYLLLTATPWNNRREDIYNILQPFITRPEGFSELGFPPEVANWFRNREVGVENFTDNTEIFRKAYRELFLQRTRRMLREAMPELDVYAKRQAEWLPVVFEQSTEEALERIFSQFETDLFIPFVDPVRYLSKTPEQRSLLKNQRRFFLQRAESSMYALRRTIVNFRRRIEEMRQRLSQVEATAEGLEQFLLLHYGFATESTTAGENFEDSESWSEEDLEEDEEENPEEGQEEKRQQLRRTIEIQIDRLKNDPSEAERIYAQMESACESDLGQLDTIQKLLAAEFVRDHKREQVTQKVRELTSQGKKVLLISTFADTVIDYYTHMAKDQQIASQGIGMATGSTKFYYSGDSNRPQRFQPHVASKKGQTKARLDRQALLRLFTPVSTCKKPEDRPSPSEELMVLIGSETLSVGQNIQDADYLINIDLPWNPMVLEQRIGRIDRPKEHRPDKLYIYYANSESQLLRQASRLSNLNKKLVGDQVTTTGDIRPVYDTNTLGASIYGDTFFDDEVLPGYAEFIQSLVKVRKTEQQSFQELAYEKQVTTNELSLYSERELLHSEDLSRLMKEVGEDYQANPISLGFLKDEEGTPSALAALTVQYFGPNGEAIPSQQQTIFWNDQTGEQDGFGLAITTAFKTPEFDSVFSTSFLLARIQIIYDKLVVLKQQFVSELSQEESQETLKVTSERLNRIQNRIQSLASLPASLNRAVVRNALKLLNEWKALKNVQRLLKDFTDGARSQLEDASFITQLVYAVDRLALIPSENIKPTSIRFSVASLLLRMKERVKTLTSTSIAHLPEKSQRAIRLLEGWMNDPDPGYGEASWEELKTSLESNRLSFRRIFLD